LAAAFLTFASGVLASAIARARTSAGSRSAASRKSRDVPSVATGNLTREASLAAGYGPSRRA